MTRGSFLTTPKGSSLSPSSRPIPIASWTIVRYLSILNGWPSFPARGETNRTGLPESSRIADRDPRQERAQKHEAERGEDGLEHALDGSADGHPAHPRGPASLRLSTWRSSRPRSSKMRSRTAFTPRSAASCAR